MENNFHPNKPNIPAIRIQKISTMKSRPVNRDEDVRCPGEGRGSGDGVLGLGSEGMGLGPPRCHH